MIWNALQMRRSDNVTNLATEFGVSERTIRYDIEKLTLSHPIETVRGRHGGCVKLADWYRPSRPTLCPEQVALLKELAPSLDGDKLRVLNSILDQFAG